MSNPAAVPGETGPSTTAPKTPRLMSLDALRGFDMFWIAGAEDIIHSLHKATPSPVVAFLAGQLDHKAWEGVAFYDLIFPLFVFIVGISLVFSLGRTVEQHGRAGACRRIFIRAALLYLMGVFLYGGISKGIDQVRLLGVLQRIALCYLGTGLLFCFFKTRGLVIACVSLLVGYWAMMSLVPVPGVGAGHFAEGQNLANYIDREYLPFRKWDGDHDPEGLLSTLPAIATCLLGVFAGQLLMNRSLPEQKKVLFLSAAGVAGVAAGFLWGLQFPVIKKIWTSSYVLVAGGYSCLFLAAFHQIIEVWNVRKWAVPFVWIGVNPLTIYVVVHLVRFPDLADRIVGGPVKSAFGGYAPFVTTIGAMALVFWFAHLLYRRKVFIRL